MSAIDDILSSEFANCRRPQTQSMRDLGLIGELLSGQILTMRDGSKWFHPFSGNPWQVRKPGNYGKD